MLITKVSQLTRKTHAREIDVTNEQIDQWQQGMLVQDAMPHLSADEREFIMTGITATEWADAFGEAETVHTNDIPPGGTLESGIGPRTFTEDPS